MPSRVTGPRGAGAVAAAGLDLGGGAAVGLGHGGPRYAGDTSMPDNDPIIKDRAPREFGLPAPHLALSQFSIRRSDTRANSRSLSVTRHTAEGEGVGSDQQIVRPDQLACPLQAARNKP